MFSCRHVTVFVVLATVFAQGCSSFRNSAAPMVANVGPDVATRHRYRISCVYDGESSTLSGLSTGFLAKYQPRVFSAAGIPVVLRIKHSKMNVASSMALLSGILGVCSIGLFPTLSQNSYFFDCSIALPDESDGKEPFVLESRQDRAETWLFTPYLCYNGTPDVDGRRVFFEHRYGGGKSYYTPFECKWDRNTSDTPILSKIDAMLQQALAYGIAVKLKELEDSGKVDAMFRKQAEQRSAAPAHNIVQLDRDSDSGFSYTFAIDLVKTPADMKAAARAVLREFMKSIKEDYLDTFPNADAASLSVAFSNLKIEGRRIGGRAAVLTIKPISLTYDANARRGKLSVRFNAGQADEARAWIRRNVKTLARDKNIALVTGRRPPEATFRTLGEKVDGDVMEIDFRTE